MVLSLAMIGPALSQKPPTMYLGSKSDPKAHLFSYDQKFRESTRFINYNLSMTAQKQFEDATFLSTRMDLRSFPDWVSIVISANFSGIGRMGYVVYDPETGEPKEERSLITHMFIGNFSMDERLMVIKDRADNFGYLPPI